MTRSFSRMAFAMAALGLSLSAANAADPVPPEGFTALFNGKDFTNFKGWSIHEKGGSPIDLAKLTPEERQKKFDAWTENMKQTWTIDNGELVNKGKGAYLTSVKDYADYELLVEYKITATVDSGIYPKTMPQIQVWDPEQADPAGLGKALGSGGLWNNPKGSPGRDPIAKADLPAGQWNKFRILNVGERISISLNDKLVVDHARLQNFWDKKSPSPKAAPFLLQTHGPELEIRWKNIFVREISASEANAYLAKKSTEGFTSIFNGKDFEGWQGATANYEVVDGAIRCQKGKGGVLYTKAEYADFQVALEFKLPKNGNNGLAIRYPGKGDTAYDGMCELQVLDEKYEEVTKSKLDPRQVHGSAYGMLAAQRGYQRPAGEWNFQEVTVKGSRIKVELNGTIILDGDVSQVKDLMANSPHPGKDRVSGHFGFAGHNDPVSFRNIRIKRL